jgi:hypothetical protein
VPGGHDLVNELNISWREAEIVDLSLTNPGNCIVDMKYPVREANYFKRDHFERAVRVVVGRGCGHVAYARPHLQFLTQLARKTLLDRLPMLDLTSR